MARSINDIYDSIIAEKEGKNSLTGLLPSGESSTQLLDELTSDSKVAVWRLWAYITSVVIHAHEVLWDLFRADVEQIAQAAPSGTPAWYQDKVLKYQHGDNLAYVGTQYIYDPIDQSKQIVTRCAIEERGDGVVVIKAAKGEDDSLEALSAPELSGLVSYVGKVKFAGTRVSVVSLNADKLKMSYDVYYDPIIPLIEVQEACTTAVNLHLTNLPFNGALNVNKFTDILQGVNGVIDPVFKSGSAQSFSGNIVPFTVENIPASGYYTLDDGLDVMFNWIEKV